MRNRTFMIFFILLFSLVFSVAVSADDGGGGEESIIHIYHDYFIPWVAGADNCYGAYRVAVTDGEAYRALFEGGLTKEYKGGWEYKTATPEPLVYSNDIRKVRRDDLVVVTDFALGAYREEQIGNEIHHHTYYYETPYLFAGLSVVMNPVHGVPEKMNADGLSHIVLTRKLAHQYFKEDISYEGFTMLLVPGFGGANPDGTILKHVSTGWNHHKYILSLNPALPEMVGWWRMLSVETLSFINQVRSAPDLYVTPATPKQLAEIEAAKKKAYGEEKAANPGASAAPFDAGYSWDAPRIFYSPEMFGAFLREKLDRASGARDLYAYGEKFYTPFDMHNIWKMTGDKVAAGLFGNIPEPKTETVKVSMRAATGWRIGETVNAAPLEVTIVTSPPQPALVKPPFNEGEAFDAFRVLHPGTWGGSESGHGSVSITTYAPEMLARWPFGYAQSELFRLRKTSRDRLSECSVSDRELKDVISSKGGIVPFSSSAAGWSVVSKNIDGMANKSVPADTVYYASYEPAVVAPGMKSLGKTAWEQWATRDRNFYDAVIPYMSTSMGLLFWSAPGTDGLYVNKALERQFYPEISFSMNKDQSKEFSITVDDIRRLAGPESAYLSKTSEYGKRYADARQSINNAISMHDRKVAGKDEGAWAIIHGKVIQSGKEHISSVTKSNIKYVPMERSTAISGIKKEPYVDGALKSGAVDIPEKSPILEECQLHFPIDGTLSRPAVWNTPPATW